MSIRSSSYTVTEDVLLCQVYLDISQDPITGRYQSQDQFWSRVEEAYNNNKQENWAPRYKRSVQSRMTIITSEAKHDNKILLTNLNSIVDPAVREYIRVQQTKILQKRVEEQGPSSTTNDFGEFFNNIGGSEADLPDY